jgi:hypothetical protein
MNVANDHTYLESIDNNVVPFIHLRRDTEESHASRDQFCITRSVEKLPGHCNGIVCISSILKQSSAPLGIHGAID